MFALSFAVQSYTLPAVQPAFQSPLISRCALPTMADGDYTVGVLAIQGAFTEHMDALRRQSGVEALEVRTQQMVVGSALVLLLLVLLAAYRALCGHSDTRSKRSSRRRTRASAVDEDEGDRLICSEAAPPSQVRKIDANEMRFLRGQERKGSARFANHR